MSRRLFATVLAATLAVACGDAHPESVGSETRTLPPSPTGTSCSTPAPGCPCPDAGGATVKCSVKRVSGTYISCSTGTMTCGSDGTWGQCDGAATEWIDDAGH